MSPQVGSNPSTTISQAESNAIEIASLRLENKGFKNEISSLKNQINELEQTIANIQQQQLNNIDPSDCIFKTLSTLPQKAQLNVIMNSLSDISKLHFEEV